MKVQLNKKDVFWNYIGIIMNLGGNFIILPFLLYYLDDNYYGIWNVFVSLGGIVALFDFGFNTTFARNITFCWSGAKKLKKESVEYSDNAEPDFKLMKKVLGTCRIIYFLISLLALICLGVLGTAYICYIGRDIDSIDYIIAWIIYGVAIFLNLYYGYYDSFLRGVGAIADVNKLKIFSRLIQIILVAILLPLKMGIVGASIAYLAYGLLFRIIAQRRFYSYQNIGQELSKIDEKTNRNEIQEMFYIIWHNAWRDGVVSLANYLCNQITIIIASLYLSLAETGAYSLAIQLAQAIVQIASALYTAYQPTLQSAYVSRNKEKMKNVMSAIIVTFLLISILGFAALFTVGIPLLKIMKPSAILDPLCILGIGIYQIILKGRNCYTSYISSTNRVPYARSFIISGVLCVVFSLGFEAFLISGIWGLIIAQILSQLVFNAWYWPLYVHRELQLKPSEMIWRGGCEIKEFLRKKK